MGLEIVCNDDRRTPTRGLAIHSGTRQQCEQVWQVGRRVDSTDQLRPDPGRVEVHALGGALALLVQRVHDPFGLARFTSRESTRTLSTKSPPSVAFGNNCETNAEARKRSIPLIIDTIGAFKDCA
jgi:hypothetical protein